MLIYLDANVFIYAFLNQEELGKKCRQKLKFIQEGKEEAATSTLTFDEVFWKVKKERGLVFAIEAGERFLTLPHLHFIDVTVEVTWKALDIIKTYHLSPRDAIHAACAFLQGIPVIISEDKDFDVMKEVERKFFPK